MTRKALSHDVDLILPPFSEISVLLFLLQSTLISGMDLISDVHTLVGILVSKGCLPL